MDLCIDSDGTKNHVNMVKSVKMTGIHNTDYNIKAGGKIIEWGRGTENSGRKSRFEKMDGEECLVVRHLIHPACR